MKAVEYLEPIQIQKAELQRYVRLYWFEFITRTRENWHESQTRASAADFVAFFVVNKGMTEYG